MDLWERGIYTAPIGEKRYGEIRRWSLATGTGGLLKVKLCPSLANMMSLARCGPEIGLSCLLPVRQSLRSVEVETIKNMWLNG